MRGEVLHYDQTHGFGFITGEDGNRYTFRREDLRSSFSLSRGTAVAFRQNGGEARDISLPATASETQRAAALTATPIATPVTHAPQRYGRNAAGNGAAVDRASAGLWDYFRAGVTANYANFRGRARRKEYWGFALFYTLGMIVLVAAGLAVDAGAGNLDYSADIPIPVTIVLVLLAMLAGMVPWIAISVRRFHDIGLSGWFYLGMCLIGLFLTGSIILLAIVLGLIPSQGRDNKWGVVPAT